MDMAKKMYQRTILKGAVNSAVNVRRREETSINK